MEDNYDKVQKSSEVEENNAEEDIERILHGSEDERRVINIYQNINNHGVYAGDNATFENVQMGNLRAAKKKKQAVFSDVHLLNEWMADNFATYDMAVMFSIVIFEGLLNEDIFSMADILFSILESEQQEEKNKSGLTEILESLGADRCKARIKSYAGVIEVEVLKLLNAADRDVILKNIWTEYPKLHNVILDWLKRAYVKGTGIVAQRCVDTLVWIIENDESYFYYYMVDLINEERTVGIDIAFAHVIVLLSNKDVYKHKMHKLLKKWSNEKNVHRLLSCIYACSKMPELSSVMGDAVHEYLDNLYEEMLWGRRGDFSKYLYTFYAAGMRAFTFYRLVIEYIYQIMQENYSKKEQETMIKMFWRIAVVDYNLVNFDKNRDALLILLCFRNHEVQLKLYYLWEILWRQKSCRQRFYNLLARYETERAKAGLNSRLEEFTYRIFADKYGEETAIDICNKIRRRNKNE